MTVNKMGFVETAFTVSAWGTPAAGVPPHFRLLLDGLVIGEASAVSATARDYTFRAYVDPQTAHRVRVHFDNDLYVGGEDRNLFVQSVTIGDLTLKADDPRVTYDRGALDGKDVIAGRSGMLWNGALSFDAPAEAFTGTRPPAPLTTATITVNAYGTWAGGIAPHVRLLVDGKVVGTATVGNTQSEAYTFTTLVDGAAPHTIQVHYDNDAVIGGEDRNLFIRSIVVNGHEIAAADASVTYDRFAIDGRDTVAGREKMAWNGALTLTLPPEVFAPGSEPRQPTAALSAERPPLATEAWALSWGADRGLAPQHIFWDSVPDYADAGHMSQTRAIAAGHEAAGRIPVAGLQLWSDSFAKSLPGGEFSGLGGHAAWFAWMRDRPEYLAHHPDGRVWEATPDNPWGWGYVSPLMPMRADDVPAGFQGETYYYADWLADRLGALAAHTGIRGFNLADFYDGSPHAGLMDFFNDRMIADFAATTGIGVSGGSLAERAADIRAHHAVEYVDWFVDGWSYGWKALAEGIERHTGEPAWLTTQVSFGPAVMRQFAGVDVRAMGEAGMDLDQIVFNVQTLERFTMQHKPVSVAYEAAMIGTHAARAPDGHFGQMVSAANDDFWNAVTDVYKGVSGETRTELGWARLKQAWFESGWTHIAESDGGVRRAAEVWQRGYHDLGTIDPSWLDLLRDVVPTRPFGPALYYSANAEHAVNVADPLGYAISNAYLGETLTPVTRLFDAGVPFGYYASDASLAAVADSAIPSAWIIPQATLGGRALFGEAELAALKAKAPVLIADEAIGYDHPLHFTDDNPNATIGGFAFYDQNGRLIVLAADRIETDTTGARTGSAVTVHLALADGHYHATDLFDGAPVAFDVTGGSGSFETHLDRWDVTAFAVSPDA